MVELLHWGLQDHAEFLSVPWEEPASWHGGIPLQCRITCQVPDTPASHLQEGSASLPARSPTLPAMPRKSGCARVFSFLTICGSILGWNKTWQKERILPQLVPFLKPHHCLIFSVFQLVNKKPTTV